MSPSDLQADYDDEPRGNGVPFPMGVRIAAIIWIVFGSLLLIGAIMVVISTEMIGGGGPAPEFCVPAVVGSVGMFSLIAGIETIRCTNKSLGANAVGSICVGALCLMSAVAVFGGGLFPQRQWATIVLVGSIYSIPVLSLLLAGVLALMGKSAYEQWREANGLNRPRPQTPEEQDYDDQPRRPDGNRPR